MLHWVKGVFCLGTLLTCVPHTAVAADSPKTQVQNAGPYVITLNQSSIDRKAVGAVTITVRKAGKLATDLKPYGGSCGLADLTNTQTGQTYYTTVNPIGTSVSTQTPTNASPPANVGAELEVSPPASIPGGTYTLNIQLSGAGGQIYIASFTLVVQ
jgi:hypothetical protein